MSASHHLRMLIDMFRATEETDLTGGDVRAVLCHAEEEMVADLVQGEKEEIAMPVVEERGLQERADQRKHKKNLMPRWTIISEMDPNRRIMSMTLRMKLQLQLQSAIKLEMILKWLSRFCVVQCKSRREFNFSYESLVE